MNKFQYLLFDLDGTLTDPFEGITKSFQYALAAYGIHADCSELTPVIGPPLIDSFRDFYGFNDKNGMDAVWRYRERFETIGWRENKLLDGVPEMLSKLCEAGKTLALTTSKPYVFASKILNEFSLTKYFNVTVGAELDGSIGTKAEVINKALHELGSPDKSKVIMIGDRKQDVLGAKQCGISSMGVRVGYAEPNELENAGADYITDTIADLTEFLLSH